ncbi:GNAT family N-acetyltransferase [Nonomuraea aurantiaca]|uniref:GNAT family N-acetyltransferase n=1 Tax=Nonomuraea aurantiaca TaxID=2878562 RepID=UPI001CD98E5B|nr:GNAT family N-acetyltransferase [Nonomuraea aurantiaca]MCA2223451.1 GNAT family N-acetyltransferase [Nonomuraea aurantiaca]
MWTFTTDVEEYATAAEAFLLADPVGNTVPLTVLANIRAGMPADDASFGWWTRDGEVRGAAFRTPPNPIALARMPVASIASLVTAWRGEITEVLGPQELTGALAEVLGEPRSVLSERLYRLGTLIVPGTAGHGRLAGVADFPLLVAWFQAFGEEVGLGVGGDPVQQVEHRLAGRQLFLWEADGVPVSMAALSPAAGGVCRIGPVYTPPSCRRRGYGAAVTAFASRVAVETRCEQVVLFADLANPTSNAVYRSIGYEPVYDYAQVTFGSLP